MLPPIWHGTLREHYLLLFGAAGLLSAVTGTVSAWLGRWMDVDDERKPGRDGLHRVVHFASDPAKRGKGVALAIDLGSAPPEALVDLLDALAAVGARRVRIASQPSAA